MDEMISLGKPCHGPSIKQRDITLMDEMVSSKGPVENFGLRSPSSSNLDSVSCKELMLSDENGGGSFTDVVRKLYL